MMEGICKYCGQISAVNAETKEEADAIATKRPISGGFGFGGENCYPIEACSLALYGAKTSKRDPKRKMRIG